MILGIHMVEECFFLTRLRKKSDDDGSYDYIGRSAGNPQREGTGAVHPYGFINSKGLHFSEGFTLRLGKGDPSALRELREKALKEAQWKDGHKIRRGEVYQVRRNYGGINVASNARKLLHSLNGHHTKILTGTKIIIEDFEV